MDLIQVLLTPGVMVAGVVFLWRVYVHGRAQDREYVKASFDGVRVEFKQLGDVVAEVRGDVRALSDRVTDIDKRLVALETLVQERSAAAVAAGMVAMQSFGRVPAVAATLEPGSAPIPPGAEKAG